MDKEPARSERLSPLSSDASVVTLDVAIPTGRSCSAGGPLQPDIYDPAFQEDPFPVYAELRKSQPVYREPRYGAFLLTRFDDVLDALRDHETWRSGAGPAPMPGTFVGVPVLAATDPPYHDQLRSLVNRAFTPRRIEKMAPRIETLGRELVDALPDGEFDLVSALSIPLPVTVIAEMLGVPPERQPEFRRWSNAFVGLLENPPTPELTSCAQELITYFRGLAEERRASPGDDLVSGLLEAEIDGRRLSQNELDAFFIMLLVAGNETTTNLISNQLSLLSSRPDLWEKLRADRSLIPAAIEETVRWDGPVQNLGREATRDVSLRGVEIPKGSRLVVSFGAASRDPAAFDDPEAYRLDRGTFHQLGFGQGVHFCLGSGLARLEGRVAVNALLDRFTEIAPGTEPATRLHSTVIRGFESLPLQGVRAD
jgi:cytochrome P450